MSKLTKKVVGKITGKDKKKKLSADQKSLQAGTLSSSLTGIFPGGKKPAKAAPQGQGPIAAKYGHKATLGGVKSALSP